MVDNIYSFILVLSPRFPFLQLPWPKLPRKYVFIIDVNIHSVILVQSYLSPFVGLPWPNHPKKKKVSKNV